jgi:hypothetical protein
MARRLTAGQREVLSRERVDGVCIRYVWVWLVNEVPVTRQVNALTKRGLMDASYYRGGQATASVTDAGRIALEYRP